MDIRDEITAYLARTGTPISAMSKGATGSISTLRSFMVNGHEPRETTVAKFREWMAANPDGIAPKGNRIRRPTYRRVQIQPTDSIPQPVDRDPCFKCGVRADVGCSHRPVAAYCPESGCTHPEGARCSYPRCPGRHSGIMADNVSVA